MLCTTLFFMLCIMIYLHTYFTSFLMPTKTIRGKHYYFILILQMKTAKNGEIKQLAQDTE